MQSAGGSTSSAKKSSSDIVFTCENCSSSFIVDGKAAGVTLKCQKCGHPTTAPSPVVQAMVENSLKVSDVQRQLKENESQRTEVTGYINQLSIQLHRWQLRMKTLKERQEKLEAEITASGATVGKPSGASS